MSGSDPAWTAPGGDEPPRWGERAAVPSPAPASAPAPAPAWTPPPRPGLVPLHPLGFGQMLGVAFAAIRWNPRATILPAVLVNLAQAAVLYGATTAIALPGLDRLDRASDADRGPILAGLVAEGSGVALLSVALSVIASAVLQGIVVTVVARGALGERPALGSVLRAAGRRVLPLAGFGLVIGVAELVVVGLLAGVVLLVAQGGVIGIAVAVLVALVGALGVGALALWITTKLAVTPSAIVLEGLGVRAGIARSWRLTRGAFWRTLGLILLVGIIVSAAAQLVSLPVSLVGGAITGLLQPNAGRGDALSALSAGLVGGIPATAVAVVVSGIGQIAQSAALVLVYLDRRMRLEGLDIELQRAAETPGGPDPFAAR